jgi:hypothetical protein
MPKIVISYRRSDTAAMAGRIFDQLTTHYGDDAVFMDIANIPFGIDYRSHFRQTLERTDVLIALIAANWLGRSEAGVVRIQEAADPVRIEIETALERKIPIIPVLIDGAKMPDSGELPASFGDFVYLNAADVSSGRDFHTHMGRLFAAIDRIVEPAGSPDAPLMQPLRTQVRGPFHNAFMQILRIELAKYLLVPLVVLLVCHYIIVNLLNLNSTYLWLACALVSFASGSALLWNGNRDIGPVVIFALALGLMSVVAMTVSESLYSGDPMLPQTRFEWFNNLQFAGTIVLGFIVGYLLALPFRTLWWRKLKKS